jgi:glycine cleavage system H protein
MGLKVSQSQELATVESTKAASDIFSPVTGEVIEVNSELETKPELINEDCYENGWICRMKITDSSVMGNLMDSKQYTEHIEDL